MKQWIEALNGNSNELESGCYWQDMECTYKILALSLNFIYGLILADIFPVLCSFSIAIH